jgi:hypothetical protein
MLVVSYRIFHERRRKILAHPFKGTGWSCCAYLRSGDGAIWSFAARELLLLWSVESSREAIPGLPTRSKESVAQPGCRDGRSLCRLR